MTRYYLAIFQRKKPCLLTHPLVSVAITPSSAHRRGFFIIFSGVFSAYILATMIRNMPVDQLEAVRSCGMRSDVL